MGELEQKLRDIVIVDGVRVPIGRFGGSLKDFQVYELGAIVIREVLRRTNIDPADVDEVVFSHTRQDGNGTNPGRTALLMAGIPYHVPAHTTNQVCATGLLSVRLAAQSILLGENKVVVVAGAESMSNIPHLLRNHRFNPRKFRLGDVILEDGFTTVQRDRYCGMSVLEIAEKTAEKYGLTREELDRFSYESHKKAVKAWEEGVFKNEVMPVKLPDGRLFERDECLRPDVDLEKMLKLPCVVPGGKYTTAGNTCAITDGAGAMVIMHRSEAERRGLKPLAHLVSWAFVGVDPRWFTEGPGYAIPAALEKVGLTLDDMKYVEINEAFASQMLANIKQLNLDPAKVNVHGGAIADGHPTGYSGVRLTLHLAHILKSGEYGVASLCGGGGMAGALVIQGE